MSKSKVGIAKTENSISNCVESQEWTYGADNTGTLTNRDALWCFTNSDGSTFDVPQLNTGSASQWTPQMLQVGTDLQAAADAAGMQWFVDTRYIHANSDNLTGGGGFSGPPSSTVSKSLYEGGMRARYLNIQICPGQPVPVRVVWKELDGPGGNVVREVEMTTAGAVLGPINKFWICSSCDDDSGKLNWMKEDPADKTVLIPALAGEIPNCWEPCGTLALVASPPDRECVFFFSEACDNVNDTDPANWVNLVTRRSTVCQGVQIAVDYFVPDPGDSSRLINYPLVGDFVDCSSGEPVEKAVAPCENFESIGTVYTLENFTPGVTQTQYEMENQGDNPVTVQAAIDEIKQWTVGPDGVPTPADNGTLTVGPLPWPDLNVNESNSTGLLLDSQVLKGFVVADKPITFRYNGTPEGYQAVYLDPCCAAGRKSLIYQRSNDQGAPGEQGDKSAIIPAGIHAVTIINLDVNGTNSSAVMQASTDGEATWSNFFPEVSSTKPFEECHAAVKCIPSGVIVDAVTNVDIVDPYPCALVCDPEPVTCEKMRAYITPSSEIVNLGTDADAGVPGEWEVIGQVQDQIANPLSGQIWGDPFQIVNNLTGPVTGDTVKAIWATTQLTGSVWGYFRREFIAPQDYTMEWSAWADNWMRRIWIDGELVWDDDETDNANDWIPNQTIELDAGSHEIIIEVQEANTNNTRASFDAQLSPSSSPVNAAELQSANLLPPCNGYVLSCSDGRFTSLDGQTIVKGKDFWDCEPESSVVDAGELANAIVIAERDSVIGCAEKFQGNAVQQLTVSDGQRGNLVAIGDTGSGLVFFTTDGSAPSNAPGPNKGETTGPYLNARLNNIDLSQLRFDGSAAGSDYTVYYEKYA